MASSLRLISQGCSLGRQAVRALHTSAASNAISKFAMPAMSPTMTEGGLASWKVKEGDKFSAGDVLLEIETDKATMDVEAQDDGIMAKIVVTEGAKAVPVGRVIAMLAEEGDDISNVEVPKEEQTSSKATETKSEGSTSSSSSLPQNKLIPEASQTSETPKAKHAPQTSKPMMPSVMRLLTDFDVSAKDAESMKGSGVRGMLTKGDVLAFLGKARGPTGSFKEDKRGISALGGAAAPQKGSDKPAAISEPLTGETIRSMIFSGLAAASHASRSKEMASKIILPISPSLQRKNAFDELLDDYEFKKAVPQSSKSPVSLSSSGSKDEFAGLL